MGSLVDGGFEGLELKFKCGWRKHWSAAETRYFSRVRQLVKVIDDGANIDDIEELFSESGKKVTKTIEQLKEKGYIEVVKRKRKMSG